MAGNGVGAVGQLRHGTVSHLAGVHDDDGDDGADDGGIGTRWVVCDPNL